MDERAAWRKAVAERTTLLGLAAILTHDLSNPLQSVTVLCELGIEGDEPGEGPRRAQQSLQAAERMRDLLHAYAALVRNADRPTKLSAAVERTDAMFARRIERQRIALDVGVERDFEGPCSTGLAIVALFMALVETAETATGPFEARIVLDGPTVTAKLIDAAGTPVTWPQTATERVADILADEGSVECLHGQLEARLESPPS
ncbi:MAG: hypothetical protein KUG77_20045 [Nannocystaceae bacterium]|nr:hypothetical protein [Nannocystaceae bacterium]